MKRALVLLLSISLVLAGCTTFRYDSAEEILVSARSDLHGGETARLVLKSGEVRRITLSSVENGTLSGMEGRGSAARTVQFAVADIESMKATRTQGWRTVGIVMGVAAGVVVLAVGGILVANCGIKLDKCSE